MYFHVTKPSQMCTPDVTYLTHAVRAAYGRGVLSHPVRRRLRGSARETAIRPLHRVAEEDQVERVKVEPGEQERGGRQGALRSQARLREAVSAAPWSSHALQGASRSS